MWIGCDVPLAALQIPPGGTPAAFPPEPTRLRVRAASAGQGRLLGRLEEVALTGACPGAREFRLQFVPFDEGTDLITIAAMQYSFAIGRKAEVADARSK
jgi:hypothetical protein